MRIAILVSYNEQLVKRAFGFVVYACMQPCSHADRRVVALVVSLLYVGRYCARRTAYCVLVPLHTLCCHYAYWLCCARCIATTRRIAFCALMHRVPVANKSKRALLKKTRNRAKAGM